MDLEETDDAFQEFKRVTLELSDDELNNVNEPLKSQTIEIVDNSKSKNRWENSFISPIVSIPERITETFKSKNTESSNSKSLRPAASLLTIGEATDFFTFRQGIVEQAVNECVEQFLDVTADGPLKSSFLLTQITLWDVDKERLILITSKTIVIVKYDFIAMKRLEYKKLPLDCIDTIMIGDLIYPQTSIVPRLNGLVDGLSSAVQNCLIDIWSKNKTDKDLSNCFHPRNRNMRGIRLMWNNGKPLNFTTKWNPLNNDVQFCTFTTHPLFFHRDCINEEQKKIYNIEEFIESVCSTVTQPSPNGVENKKSCIIHHKDILLDNYVGIGSLIHNRNALGFFKVRGRFSF